MTKQFRHDATGLELAYPIDWIPKPMPDYVFAVAPSTGAGVAHLSIDVPELPPHIPGLIPIGLVKNGYVDDLKKLWPNVKVEDAVESRVDGANARLVRSSHVKSDGRRSYEIAMLMVKGDHVVILRGNADDVNLSQVERVFNEVLSSIRWRR